MRAVFFSVRWVGPCGDLGLLFLLGGRRNARDTALKAVEWGTVSKLKHSFSERAIRSFMHAAH